MQQKPKSLNDAILFLQMNARSNSKGQCAAYVRMALNHGGFDVKKSGDAKNYGSELERVGFAKIQAYDGTNPSVLSTDGYMPSYSPTAGDISIIQPYSGGSFSGHMAMYDGKRWVSDFRQNSMYPGNGYRNKKPAFIIYRC